MNKEEIENKIIKIFEEVLFINNKVYKIKSNYKVDGIITDNDGDSLSKLEIVLLLENEFHIAIENEDMDSWVYIDDITLFICTKIKSEIIDFNILKNKANEEYDKNVQEFYRSLSENKKYNNLTNALMKIREISEDKRNIIYNMFFTLNHPYMSTFGSYFNVIFNKYSYLNLPHNLTNILDFIDYNITDDGCFALYRVDIYDKHLNEHIIQYYIDTTDNPHEKNRDVIRGHYYMNQYFGKLEDYEIANMKIAHFDYDIDHFTKFLNILFEDNSYENIDGILTIKENVMNNLFKFNDVSFDD